MRATPSLLSSYRADSYKGINSIHEDPTFMTSSNLSHLPKALPPNALRAVEFPHKNWRMTQRMGGRDS